MEIQDNEFKKLVGKSKKKRYLMHALISVATVLIISGVTVGGYLFYYNYYPFQDSKAAGVPNGKLVVKDNDVGVLKLLIESSGSYAFNSDAKEVSVYVDAYEKGKKVKHELVTNIGTEPRGMSGSIDWIMEPTTDDKKLGKLKSEIMTTEGASSRGEFDLGKLKFDASNGVGSSGETEDSMTLALNKEYVLRMWTTGGNVYSTLKDTLSEHKKSNAEQLVVLYAVFE
ncbi:hypothetical protein OL233_01870 [Vagococcus sp. PNs007]|uniref:Uncharacterized protein n=1 Tax=Vagococcus proximus TaxID=2991417 RepID=A0ABT5WZ35_9ENTE|nr:hypothetical protein [Vagococcus proximus]MDF0479020.1 hypothetical protein [Vagococcus proximus]